VNRLPPGLQCAETDDDVRCWLSILRRSVEPGRSGGRTVLSRPTNRVIDSVITALQTARQGWSIATAASV
jgi:hypothetical protein